MLLGLKPLSPPTGTEVGCVSARANAKTDPGDTALARLMKVLLNSQTERHEDREGQEGEDGGLPGPGARQVAPSVSSLLRFAINFGI